MRTQKLKTILFSTIALLLLNLSVQGQSSVPEKPTDINPLLIGETIPTIDIPDANGKSFDLNARAAEKPTILIFYRGGWCPFCNKELAGIQSI